MRKFFLTDLAASLVFVLIGLHAHHHSLLGDVLLVWYPFALGVLGAWALVRSRSLDGGSWRTGVVVALVTVVTAMILRVLNGQGTVPAFCLVALVFVTLFFTLHRGIFQFFNRRR
jgi:hypothetical protein